MFLKDIILRHPWPLYKPRFLRQDFINDIFSPYFYNRLQRRKDTFLEVFKRLQDKPEKTFKILETGTARGGMLKIEGDGASSLLFDIFLQYYDGRLISIDIDGKACDQVRKWVSKKSRVVTSDSYTALVDFKDQYDFIYLDSMDIHWQTPEKSALHHLREFQIIEPFLPIGGLLLIDDSPVSEALLKSVTSFQGTIPWPNGKGYLVLDHIKHKSNFRILRHDYQCLLEKIKS